MAVAHPELRSGGPGAGRGGLTAAAFTIRRAGFARLLSTALIGLATAATAQPAAQDAVAAYNRGVEAEHAGRHQAAIADLTRAIALKPDFAAAYASRGVAEDQMGFYARAVADDTRALDLKGGDERSMAETYFNRGAAYEHRRLYPRARADYAAALTHDPGLQAALDGLQRLSGRR